MLVRLYLSPPASSGEPARITARSQNRSDFTLTMLLAAILVNSPGSAGSRAGFRTESQAVFRSFFSKKNVALTGAPAVRRLKTYSAQSGYVYQYFYQGHRPLRAASEGGTEFVFSISADAKTWHPASVMLGDGAVRMWETAHERELSSTERYAVAKMALFQAFDERPLPAQMKEDVRVRAADVEAILETLGL